jgi:hypothetical protein
VSTDRNVERRLDPAPPGKSKVSKKRGIAKSKPKASIGEELPLEAERPVAKLDFSDDSEAKS